MKRIILRMFCRFNIQKKKFKIYCGITPIVKHTLILFVSMLLGFSMQAQTPDKEKAKSEKLSLAIKPNSRDMTVAFRDNKMHRIHKKRNKAMDMRMQQLRQQQIMKKSVKQGRRQEIMQRRKQIIQQRRTKR